MATAWRRPARRFHDSIDEKAWNRGSLRFRSDFFGVYDFLGRENDPFLRGTRHFNVELLVAQDLCVSLSICFLDVDQCPVRLEGGNRIEFLFGVGVFNREDAALFRNVAPVESANGLEGDAVGCGPQPSKYAGSGVFGQAGQPFFNRLSIVRRQSEFCLERNDAADDFLHGACGAKEISVVTGRGLDEREVSKTRARNFADERGGRSVQKRSPGTDRVSLADERSGFS